MWTDKNKEEELYEAFVVLNTLQLYEQNISYFLRLILPIIYSINMI